MKRVHRNILYKKKINKISKDNDIVYYIKSCTNKLINKNEIESSRLIITKLLRKNKHNIRKKKIFWININFLLPYTKKSSHSRMGKGKGLINSYKNYINLNTTIFKFKSVNLSIIIKLFNLIRRKLSFPIAIYRNNEYIRGKLFK